MGEAEQAPEEWRGLTEEEARRRLVVHGPNRLVARERSAWAKELARLFLDPMALMLLTAAALYLVLGETRDGVVMLIALVPVVGVDVLLEARSRAALKKLAASVAPRARVVREGREVAVDTAALVPGDVVVLAEGDVAHADGVVRQAANLAFDESSLTGESEPQGKQATGAPGDGPLPDDARFYAGSIALSGQGIGELLTTGRATRFGEIARLVATAASGPTPLQRRVGRMVRRLAVVAALVAVAVFGLGLLHGQRWTQALLGGVSLAMAAIPEEFPLVFTLFLSVGAWRLGRRGVLVRRLASVETLGSTTVICTDKTGTLTKGQFAVETIEPMAAAIGGQELLEACVLGCETPPRDPMEKAMVAHAAGRGLDVQALLGRWRLVRDHDFDPVGKHMSHVWERADGGPEARVIAKGALEGILEHCAISTADRAAAEAAQARLAALGMRVLALAGRTGAPARNATRADDERDLSLQALVGFRDPIRPEIAAAVAECRAAGIRIKLVTGDHPLTAQAIAELAGLPHTGVVTGAALACATEEERARRIAEATVLARIDPAQKHTIVETLKAGGEIVAMTGDGINDAPALRAADIGISMGQRATEVARAAADLVLLDDNFGSIVAAIREGRKILFDIQRAFLYLLAFHVPIVGLALLAPIWGAPLLLLPIHLVWLELVVHPVSALLFQGDPAPADLMRRPPRDPAAPLLPRRGSARSLASGALLTAAVFAVYLASLGGGDPSARGLALATLLAGYQLLVIAERAGPERDAGALLPRSRRFWLVWLVSGASLPILMYLPAAAEILRVAPLSVQGWLVAIAVGTGAVGWRLLPWGRQTRGG